MAAADQIEEILRKPYARELVPNGDGTFFACIVEFPGCMTEGDDEADALENLKEAMRLWVEAHVEDGVPVPEPANSEGYGEFIVRVTKTLHRDLVRSAQREGVTLNQFVATRLADSVGKR